MNLTFLGSESPLTKTYARQGKTLIKTPYPMVSDFTSYTEQCDNLKHFADLIKQYAAKGRCLLKGNVNRELHCESRAGSTDTHAATHWVCFDVDGLPDIASAEDFMEMLGFANVSYVVQYSASYGIENMDLRCHIFVMLDKPMPAPLLKQWLIQLNLDNPTLSQHIKLTKTGNTLSWPLDVTACQNDKLLYIAPPKLGAGISSPLPDYKRIVYVRKQFATLSITDAINPTSRNRELTTGRVVALRDALGYPPRKFTYKMHGHLEVMVKPDTCSVTDMKVERGFVYFNLNGGDSWAYYHPEDNPEYIHNFKGEAAYLTKELLPDYWDTLINKARTDSTGTTYLAFLDAKSSSYWRGTYSTVTDELELYQARTETMVRDFAKQHGLPLGDFIPEWEMTFDPHDGVRVDPDNRTINMFSPTPFMMASNRVVRKCPPTIFKILHHVLGNDDEITEHFINWLAYIVQKRDRTKTAWVLHGTQGTGKGVLFNRILRPLLGARQTATRRMEELNESYNGYMESCFIVFVDEVQTKALNNERGVIAKLKNFITEETTTVRQMYRNSYEVRNYSNWIFASNMADPVAIDKEDRRFNVGNYQDKRLDINDIELGLIDRELQSFYHYLANYSMDEHKASTPIETEDRTNMISISESSLDTTANALLNGDFEFFIDQLPTTMNYTSNALEFNRTENYNDLLKDLYTRTDNIGGCRVTRDELKILFDYTVGNVPTSPNKFTSMLKHHRIHTVKLRVDGTLAYGIYVVWKDYARFNEYKALLFPPPKLDNKAKRRESST